MDVQDRSTRLDALSATALGVPNSAAGVVEPLPATTPSFADSLQRTPTKSVPAADAPVSASQSLAELVVNSVVPTETAAPTEANVLVREQPALDENNFDPGLESLVAGLMAAASIPTLTVPATTPVETSVAPPPALVPALTPTATGLTEIAPTANAAPIEPSPGMPSGLKCCLTPAPVAAAPPLTETMLTGASADNPQSASELGVKLPAQPASEIAPPQVRSPSLRASRQLTEALSSADVPTTVAPETASSAAITTASTSNDAAKPAGDLSAQAPPVPRSTKTDTSSESAVKPSGRQATRDLASAKPVGDSITVAEGLAVAIPASIVPPDQSGPLRPDRNATRSADSATDRTVSAEAWPLTGWNANADGLRASSAEAVVGPGDLGPAGSRLTIPTVVDQLHPVLERAVAHERQLTITLRPPELGAVQIEITRHEGTLSARLHTETASAQQLLTEQLPQLHEMLKPLGVAAEQVQIQRWEAPPQNSAGFDGSASGQTDAQTAGGRQDDQPQRGPEPRLAEEPEREEPARPNIRTRTALNLRI